MSGNYVGRAPAPGLEVGRLLQVVEHRRIDVVGSAVAIPADDTVPQISEGIEFFTVTITPRQVGSRLCIRSIAQISGSAAAGAAGALFQNPGPNALAVAWGSIPGANFSIQMHLMHEVVSAALTPVTFSARYGPAGAITLTLNGWPTRAYGGALASLLRIEEYGA